MKANLIKKHAELVEYASTHIHFPIGCVNILDRIEHVLLVRYNNQF